MARKLRYILPELPVHVVQRGINRQACFTEVKDYATYMRLLQQSLLRYDVQLYAFVLMTNHVHLLLQSSTVQGIPWLMQHLGSSYARYFNISQQRTGALFEGRYHASIIDSERYLLACYRYIELNPVRAGIVEKAEDYQWSSYQANALGKPVKCLTQRPEYLALGQNTMQRLNNYQQLCRYGCADSELKQLRMASQRNSPVGSEQFIKQLEQQLRVDLSYNTPGRPRKNGVRVL